MRRKWQCRTMEKRRPPQRRFHLPTPLKWPFRITALRRRLPRRIRLGMRHQCRPRSRPRKSHPRRRPRKSHPQSRLQSRLQSSIKSLKKSTNTFSTSRQWSFYSRSSCAFYETDAPCAAHRLQPTVHVARWHRTTNSPDPPVRFAANDEGDADTLRARYATRDHDEETCASCARRA